MSRLMTNDYPVGVPFHPPQQAADPTLRLRRWTLALLGAAALVVVVTTAAGVFWANQLGRRVDPAPTPEDAVAQQGPAPATASRAQADRLLGALGGLSIAHLCQTYFNLGLLEDGVENEAYTKAEAEKTLVKVLVLMDQVEGHLKKVQEAELEPADQKAVQRIGAASQSLRAQAKALRAYWMSGAKEQCDRYQAARAQALAAITELEAKE